MKKEYFLYIIIVSGLLLYLFYILSQIRIIVDFCQLEPFKRSLPVYYKGFKLGHTAKIYPGPDYKSTRVVLKIRMKDLKLPANTTAIVRRKDKKDYIELIYPSAPYLAPLRNNSVIEGTKGANFESYLQDQADNGGLDEIKENVNNTIKEAGETFQALTDMINMVTLVIEDSRPLIVDSVNNINYASKNIADSSLNVRTSLQEGYINNTLYNLEKITKNLEETTQNMTGITGNINKRSIDLANCILKNTNIVIENINTIIVGIGNTLKKRLGGLRLFLGKTITCDK